jgi:hypothetical protein
VAGGLIVRATQQYEHGGSCSSLYRASGESKRTPHIQALLLSLPAHVKVEHLEDLKRSMNNGRNLILVGLIVLKLLGTTRRRLGLDSRNARTMEELARNTVRT